ncbi:unnamed protein product [Sphagnum troendelagicum]|jgi:hypothetical protein|uniref:Uncharacterized protein n=1 Tax=Sphagnum jensenii TaxID=128206 RepID=A0ABP0W6H2_9BRYO
MKKEIMSSGQQHTDNKKKPGERGIEKLNQSTRRRITHFTASVVAVVGSDQEHKGELDLGEKKKFSRRYKPRQFCQEQNFPPYLDSPTAFVRNREQTGSSGTRRGKLAEPTSASARQAKGRFATTPAPRSRDEEDFGRERGSAHVSMHTSPSVVRRGGAGGGSRREPSLMNPELTAQFHCDENRSFLYSERTAQFMDDQSSRAFVLS